MSPPWSQQVPFRGGTRIDPPPRPNIVAPRKSGPAQFADQPRPAAPAFSPARRGLRLPPEIGFLVHYGVSAAHLAIAVRAAGAQGVTADRFLLAEGQISEDQFYRALARHLRLAFVDGATSLDPRAPYPRVIATGIAPLAAGQNATLLVAPRGVAIAQLIAARRPGQAANIALTTPAHLAKLARATARGEIARAASLDLYAFDPDLCAKGGMNRHQALAFTILGSLIAFFVPLAPFGTAMVGAAFVGLIFLAMLWLRLAACGASLKPASPRKRVLAESELPIYSIIVPLYREARVVPQLLGAIGALAYPRAKLDVKFVIEADDHETLTALTRLGVPPFCEIIVAPPGVPRTKPRALNVALPLVRGSLVAVYDAEDIPDPEQLRSAAARFAAAPASVACLQARLAIDNIGDGWLAQLFAIEYAALFDVVNAGFSALRIPFPLGGTSNHFRADALRRIGGWDAWNVTEDADIGLRLARFGYEIETLDSTTYEEAPASLTAFFNQRRRWCKGWYQTLIVLWRHPRRLLRDLGPERCASITVVLLANSLGSLAAPLCGLCLGGDLLLGTQALPANSWGDGLTALWSMVILASLPGILWPALQGMRRRGLLRFAPVLCLLPAYSAIICAAAWTAIYDLCRHPYHWAKTAHGLTRRRPAGVARPLPIQDYCASSETAD